MPRIHDQPATARIAVIPRPSRRHLAVVVGAVLAAALLFPGAPAHATYPGQNGKISIRTGSVKWGGIGLINPDGTGQQNLASGAGGSFSSDGNKILFGRAGGRDLGQDPEIWIMNADGSDQTPLTLHRGRWGTTFTSYPQFSPDGSKIVFQYTDRTGYPQIRIMNADGTGESILTENGGFPRFSPDGNTIIYSELPGPPPFDGSTLVSMGVDGSGKHQIPAAGFGITHSPDFSPDGTKIAYIAQVSEREWRPFLANANGSGAREIGVGTTFSPDGTQLAGAGSLVNLDGSNLHQIVSYPSGLGDWQPVTPATRNGPLNLALCDGKPATISATPGRDLLPNLGGPDVIASLGGNDVIKTGGESSPGNRESTLRYRTHDTVCGGDGDDKLITVDRSRDVVDCGPGKDRARVDAIDRVKHCERVKKVKAKVKKHHR